MIKRKFKKFVVPTVYSLAIFAFVTSMYFLEKTINNNRFKDNEDMEYVDSEIINNNEYIPVINQEKTILKPFLNEDITISKKFYDYESESTNQENALIYYENTYIQNSGIDYTSKESFDIIAIYDGTVIEVSDNAILGKTIKIRHNNDLVSTYQSLSDAGVKENDTVLRGQVIGKSGTCNLYKNDYNLHFEIYDDDTFTLVDLLKNGAIEAACIRTPVTLGNMQSISLKKEKMIAGVCGGMAEYFNIDPTLVRLGWVVFGLTFGTGILAYIICAFVIPEGK